MPCLTIPDRPPLRRAEAGPYNRAMDERHYKVTVERGIEDLIPVFLNNRRKELETLREALAAADFEQLRQLGHRMKGVGVSYGFDHVSTLGKHIEDGARMGDRASLAARIDEYALYLSKVQISYA
jgi:HPt (histidine-containing phosphotransfer) domain-containing protein